MKEEKPHQRPQAAQYAKIASLAMWPLGIVLGLVLSTGQDSAGATLGFTIGLAVAAVSSVLFGLVFWFCSSDARVHLAYRYRWVLSSVVAIAIAAFVAWYTTPMFEAQQYSLRVKNFTSSKLAKVEIRFAGITVPIGHIDAGAEVYQEGLTKRPTGGLSVTWVDVEGTKQSVIATLSGGPPRRYDGGKLVVNVLSQYDIASYFLKPPLQ